jgi:hypothetical protein
MAFDIQEHHFRAELKAVCGHVFTLITRPSIKKYCQEPITRFTSIEVLPQLVDAIEPACNPKKLPASYLHWLAQPRRDENSWLVLNPEQTYIVSLPDADYRILATRGEEFLMSKEGMTRSPFFLIDSDGPSPREVGHNFQEALSP